MKKKKTKTKKKETGFDFPQSVGNQHICDLSSTFLISVPPWRNRFSKEYDEGLYTGTTLLLAYESVSLPFSIISSALSACILYPYVYIYD